MSKGQSILNAVAGMMSSGKPPQDPSQSKPQPQQDPSDSDDSSDQGQQEVGDMTVDQLKGVICDECHDAISTALGGHQSSPTGPQGQ